MRVACWLLAILLTVASVRAAAAEHYVRADATGDGSGTSWANACPGLSDGGCATLTRGDTYFVASGSYGSYLFDTPEDGTKVITIRKAVAADHGADDGWSDAWGAGQAVFGNARYAESYWDFAGVNFATGYWTFDGATGSGPDPAAYGFAFQTDASGADEYYLQITAAQSATFAGLTFRHVAITCSGSGTHGEQGLAAGTQSDIVSPLVQYLYVDNCQVAMFLEGSDWLIEHSYFGRQWSGDASSGLHGVPVQDSYAVRTTFRSNVVTQCQYICIEGETEGRFYDNVFDPHFSTPEGIVSGSSNQPVLDTVIYGNTVMDSTGPILWQQSQSAGASGNVVQNNLFYSSSGALPVLFGAGAIDHGHNAYFSCTDVDAVASDQIVASGDPFVSSATGDFHLVAATLPGTTLPAPYDVDAEGTARGADGVWDRGAFEYCAGGCLGAGGSGGEAGAGGGGAGSGLGGQGAAAADSDDASSDAGGCSCSAAGAPVPGSSRAPALLALGLAAAARRRRLCVLALGLAPVLSSCSPTTERAATLSDGPPTGERAATLTDGPPAASGRVDAGPTAHADEPGRAQRVLPPPMPQRPQVVVACSKQDETYYSTCDKLDASPTWPKAPAPYEHCAATLRRGVFMADPPAGSAHFDADVTRVMCANLGCGYSYCAAVRVAPASAARPRPTCGKNWESPVCFPAPPAGVSRPGPAPFPDCPEAVQLSEEVQRLDVETTTVRRQTPASAHSCCYMQCLVLPG